MTVIDPETYTLSLHSLVRALREIRYIPLDAMIAQIDELEAVGRIACPFLFEKRGRYLEQDRAIIEAARPLAVIADQLRLRGEAAVAAGLADPFDPSKTG